MQKLAIAFSILILACACSRPPAQTNPSPPPASYFQVDAATAARITGHAILKGPAPKRQPILMDSEEDCMKFYQQAPLDEAVLVNPDGTLQNVFVYVKAGLEGKQFPPVEQPLEFDQRGCMFRPRVVGLRAGQTLKINNSDTVTHNIHPMPKANREWNQGQPPGSPPLERKFDTPEVIIPVKCNVHAWMRSYIAVLPHPYFAVTGAAGSFEIGNLPPGEYTIEAWHERYGAQERKVNLAPSGEATLEFSFK